MVSPAKKHQTHAACLAEVYRMRGKHETAEYLIKRLRAKGVKRINIYEILGHNRASGPELADYVRKHGDIAFAIAGEIVVQKRGP